MRIFLIFIIYILTCYTLSKYIDTPAHTFTIDTENNPYWTIFLSPDTDQLMIYSIPKNKNIYLQDIYNFNGTKNCSI